MMPGAANEGTVVRYGLWATALAAVLGLGVHHARAVASDPPPPMDDVIQVLADLTAIDADCRDLAVNYGVGFRYAADLGLSPATVMPTGSRRAAFDKALQATQDNYGPAIVCGTLAHHYSVALPGSVTFPVTRDGS